MVSKVYYCRPKVRPKLQTTPLQQEHTHLPKRYRKVHVYSLDRTQSLMQLR